MTRAGRPTRLRLHPNDGVPMTALHTLTLADVLRDHARSWPDRTAAVCDDARLTWPQLDERVSRLANLLSGHGTGPGDRVLWLGQNCHRLVEGLLACAKIGAVFCPANWRQSADELAYVITDSAPRVVIWQDEEVGEAVRAAREIAGGDAVWIQHDAGADDSAGYEAALAATPADDPDHDVDGADPVMMMYTAAFEGRPRGALLSHAGLLHQGLAIALIQGIDPGYTYLNCGPLFHIATFMTTFATFHLGGTNVFTRRADAEEILRLIVEERCNGAFLLHPTVQKMGELNADGQYDLSSLVTMKMGVPGFDEHISQASTPWIRKPGGYGQTEATGLVTYTAFADGGGFSSGRSSPVAIVRIVDEDGNEAPVGETGEIVVRGPIAMVGYHGADEVTAERQRGGWHHTHDIGRRETDGSVTFVGPKTKLIKTGAENVYPAEVEACLTRHPRVHR